MNKVILCGRMTKDPDVRYSQSGTAVARYSLAVDRRFKKDGEPSADFINCIAFGKGAEFTEKYLRKGSKIIVEGHIQTGSYTAKDGHKVYTTDVIVDAQEFAESKQKGNQDAQSGAETAGNGASGGSSAEDIGDGFMSIPEGVEDSGLPFN